MEIGKAPTLTCRPVGRGQHGRLVRFGDGDLAGRRIGQQAEPLGDEGEVLGAHQALKADEVGAEEAFDDLAAPRQAGEQLPRRERDVEEEPDRGVRSELADHLRDELQLVVVDPDHRVRVGRPPPGWSANRSLTAT